MDGWDGLMGTHLHTRYVTAKSIENRTTKANCITVIEFLFTIMKMKKMLLNIFDAVARVLRPGLLFKYRYTHTHTHARVVSYVPIRREEAAAYSYVRTTIDKRNYIALYCDTYALFKTIIVDEKFLLTARTNAKHSSFGHVQCVRFNFHISSLRERKQKSDMPKS